MKMTEEEFSELMGSIGESIMDDIDDTIESCKKTMESGMFRDGYVMGLLKMREYTLHTLCNALEIAQEDNK